MLNEQPDSPSPISAPAERSSSPGVVACAISARPSAYNVAPITITRLVPKRSAMPPAKGCPIPHSKFWMANAIENTSRPQWLVCDSGVRKKPSEERGPKLIIAIRQPQTTTTTGVRQPNAIAETVADFACIRMIRNIAQAPGARGIGRHHRA